MNDKVTLYISVSLLIVNDKVSLYISVSLLIVNDKVTLYISVSLLIVTKHNLPIGQQSCQLIDSVELCVQMASVFKCLDPSVILTLVLKSSSFFLLLIL